MPSSNKKNLGVQTLGRLGALTVAVAAAFAFAAPSASASVSYSLHAATDYSRAQTWTSNGNQGKSYAQHGSRVAQTGWTTQYSTAYADAGTSNSYRAQASWR
ncbi:hypothetical protein BPY_21600 [Bifidobacterium psychraerophilum]|uniref:hypothetical protein n=1 Tax=Bifidobacterium psychraerophilum TaxID=218140 RepID=UPI003113F41C